MQSITLHNNISSNIKRVITKISPKLPGKNIFIYPGTTMNYIGWENEFMEWGHVYLYLLPIQPYTIVTKFNGEFHERIF